MTWEDIYAKNPEPDDEYPEIAETMIRCDICGKEEIWFSQHLSKEDDIENSKKLDGWLMIQQLKWNDKEQMLDIGMSIMHVCPTCINSICGFILINNNVLITEINNLTLKIPIAFSLKSDGDRIELKSDKHGIHVFAPTLSVAISEAKRELLAVWEHYRDIPDSELGERALGIKKALAESFGRGGSR
ncbi:MAG: hypothetical protein ACTSX2_05465 [Candidatus Thorarchaeota archaeon]